MYPCIKLLTLCLYRVSASSDGDLLVSEDLFLCATFIRLFVFCASFPVNLIALPRFRLAFFSVSVLRYKKLSMFECLDMHERKPIYTLFCTFICNTRSEIRFFFSPLKDKKCDWYGIFHSLMYIYI
jgi:hypothetical protein